MRKREVETFVDDPSGDQGREKQLKINMANFFEANLTNVTKMSSTADDEAKVPLGIIINSIACPFTVVLNLQVIIYSNNRYVSLRGFVP